MNRIITTKSCDFSYYTYDSSIDLYRIKLNENEKYIYKTTQFYINAVPEIYIGNVVISFIPEKNQSNLVSVYGNPTQFTIGTQNMGLKHLSELIEIPQKIFPGSEIEILDLCGKFDENTALLYAEKWFNARIRKSINQKCKGEEM